MAKLGCTCGHVIVDQAGGLPCKAALSDDEDGERLWGSIRRRRGAPVHRVAPAAVSMAAEHPSVTPARSFQNAGADGILAAHTSGDP